VCPLKRTWAPRGQTPRKRTAIQHNQRVNILGALLISPKGRKIKLRTQMYQHTLTGEEVIAFLRYLLRIIRGPIVLVWDKAPIHQRKKVQAFLAQHPRIHVYTFPSYAPELNPVEFVWTQTNEYLASTAPENLKQLGALVRAALHRTRRSQSRLWSCIYASELPWKH
jgi:transposase